ncbi:MAG: TIGR02099 family protein [Betaproteobacteria bacterium]|nr:TIGR02099 family protein [Betaproteobacteria bacterium]
MILVVFLVVVLALRYLVFPHIDNYRDDIAQSVSRSSGMTVSIVNVDAGWQGLRPTLTLTGVRVADRRGKAAFELERAEITLSWWSLFAGELRFRDVEFYSPRLRLRRGTDGLIYLADKPLNAAASDEEGVLTAWLLGQPRLAIHDATLAWRDELAGAPEVELHQVEIAVRKEGRRHHAALNATPPAGIAQRLDLRADLLFAPKGEAWEVSGTVYGETARTDLAWLRKYLPVPETIRTAVGSVRAWVDFEPGGRISAVTADLDIRGVLAQLDADTLPLDLDALSGRVTYRLQEGGYAAGTQDLGFRTRDGLVVRAADFSIGIAREAGRPPRGEVRANGIDLKIAAALLDYLPMPRETKALAARYAPRGRLLDSSLVWTGETLAHADSFRIKSRFENLAVNAVDGYPGVTGLTGTLDGDERGGKLRLASKGATFEAAGTFRAPIALDTLEARASWTRGDKGLEVRIDEARLANADAEVTLAGTWHSLPDSPDKSPGLVDLAGRIERVSAPAVANYLPHAIAGTRDWLTGAVLAGEVSRGRFELKGDLWHFPFRDASGGRFLVEAAIEGGRLQYHPAWPAVDRIKGDIRFENAGMDIRAREAFIYASRARSVRAAIADFGANPPVLMIDGDLDTTGVDSVRFLRETPLADGPGAFTRTVSIEGPARLKLNLAWPLSGPERFRVAGEYAFAGATASVGRNLLLTGVRGSLSFTEKSVRAPELTGSMFGQPASLRLATQPDGSVLTQLDGRMGAAVLGTFIPDSFARRFAGAAEWKAKLVSGEDGSELRVESTLKGLAIGLPEPFAKLADEPRALAVSIRRLGTASEETVATLEGGIHARIGRSEVGGAGQWNAALKFGAPVTNEPVREGLWVYGSVNRFDLDAWREALAVPAAPDSPASAALELRGLDLQFGQLRYTGRDLAQMAVRLQREAGAWRGTLASPTIAGEVRFESQGKGRVQARLTRFFIGTGTSGSAGPEPAPAAVQDDLPALDIVAERFDFRGRQLGRLEMLAHPDGAEWRIDRLDIANEHSRFASSGVWRRTATGSLTQLDLKLESRNLHSLLEQFGYGQFVNRGEAKLEGLLVWPGYPYEFSPGVLSGRFKVEAAKGQFARIEPGAGKLLGLLSLQSIPRRITLDFGDIFSEGFAFDRIAGDVRVARGILLTKDFEIDGPSARVTMAGEASLPMETQHLTVKVVPEVGEGVAIAATFLGTPVLGLTTLILQKLLKNPLGYVVSYQYLVTGSWDNPTVTQLGAAPSPQAAPAPEAPK